MKLVFPEELFSSARKTGNNNLKTYIIKNKHSPSKKKKVNLKN